MLLSPNYITYTDSKFLISEEGACNCNPKADETRTRPKDPKRPYIPTLCLLQDPRKAY